MHNKLHRDPLGCSSASRMPCLLCSARVKRRWTSNLEYPKNSGPDFFRNGAPSSFAVKSATALVAELLVISIDFWSSDLMRKTGRCVTLCSKISQKMFCLSARSSRRSVHTVRDRKPGSNRVLDPRCTQSSPFAVVEKTPGSSTSTNRKGRAIAVSPNTPNANQGKSSSTPVTSDVARNAMRFGAIIFFFKSCTMSQLGNRAG